jgi:hypothetical protein
MIIELTNESITLKIYQMKNRYSHVITLLVCLIALLSCTKRSVNKEWIKSAVIYEVNLKMHGPDGTIKSFQKELPRLQKMGVDVLWIMPIHSES